MGRLAAGLYRLCLCLAVGAALGAPAWADELPTFKLTFKADGSFEPARLEVPAGRFKIELVNESKEPVEFESIPLRKEKVLGPGVSSFVVITITRPGEYPFFDDFHQSIQGTLVVKAKD
jgi:plastocyanin